MNDAIELLKGHKRLTESGIDILGRAAISIRGVDAVTIKKRGISNIGLQESGLITIKEADDTIDADSRIALHRELYKAFPRVRAIVSVDSTWCSIWSGFGEELPPLNSLHAEYFLGPVRVTRKMECEGDVFEAAGKAVADLFETRVESHVPAAFIRNMGAVTWGATVEDAVDNAIALEEASKRAWQTRLVVGPEFSYMPYRARKQLFRGDFIPDSYIKKGADQ